MNFRVVPYDDKYDEPLRKLEQGIVQGKNIQLEILKSHFLDRAKVFKEINAFAVLNDEGTPVASAVAARATLAVNGLRFDAGLGFDLKVAREYRKQGIGKLMSETMFADFFAPAGLQKKFTTVKKSNIAVRNMLAKAVKGLWYYEFVYLTIPVKAKISSDVVKGGDKQLFRVTLFDRHDVDASYFVCSKSGLGYFNTYRMYQLGIRHISLPYRIGMWMLKRAHASRYYNLPEIGDRISFATLFNHTPQNIMGIKQLLVELAGKGVEYLMVCCRADDSIFKTLRQYSINTYGYFVVTDFPVSESDALTVDVRCL